MDTKELNALKDRAYKTAVVHGFHEEVRPDAYWLGLVMSEMGEAINADQKGLHADMESFEKHMVNGYSFSDAFYLYIKDCLEDELADIVIRLLDFAGLRGYELIDGVCDPKLIQNYSSVFEKCGLPGMLFQLMGALSDVSDLNLAMGMSGCIIDILAGCFEAMTGSDKDLWYFVEQKMKFNGLRPKLNGKEY